MSTKTFSQMVKEIESRDSYWKEVAILDFTSALWQLMQSQKISKSDLASRIGTSASYVTKIFQGNANFTIDSMVKLVRAAGGNLHIHVAKEDAHVTWNERVVFSETATGKVSQKQDPEIIPWANLQSKMKPIPKSTEGEHRAAA